MRTLLLGLVAALGLVGCNAPSPEIRIYALHVTGEDDGISALDVEVHMFDAVTGERLGCSGNNEGLEEVDASDIAYQVSAGFRHLERDSEIRLDDVEGRDLVFEVWEDDELACPGEASEAVGDDFVGASGPLPGEGLAIGPLAFENVIELELGYD